LEGVLVDAVDENPLTGTQTADVAIVGGGYVGLWTALRLKDLDPGCDVALVEADICGGGASGRNGGQLHGWWERVDSLVRRFGDDNALALARASEEAIDEIGRLESAAGLDIEFRAGGWLWTATTEAQLGAWEPALAACEAHGVTALRRLDAAELHRLTGSEVHLAGVMEDNAATVHPAKLARGLRTLALAAGVRIYEHSLVALERSDPPRLHASLGTLTARKVVIATNAWAARIPELQPFLFVVGSNIIATEPVPALLAELGLMCGQSICDSQARVIYYHATSSGRLVFGRGGGRVAPLGRVGSSFDVSERWQADAAQEMLRVQPALGGVAITHGWGGPVDLTLTSMPLLGRLGGRDDLLYGVGWSGTGIGPSVLGGKILASLALGRDDEFAHNPLVDQSLEQRYPAEPMRSLGAVLVRKAVISESAAYSRGRRPSRAAIAAAALIPGVRR
jgi:glycine/D-amino acid oxidase-like deaminating enzyme